MMDWIDLFLRIIIGGIFVYAGALKAKDPNQFFADIQGFHLLPHFFSVALALYLPWLEIVGGLSLVTKKYSTGASFLLAALMVVFLFALGSGWARGLDITCGCFGNQLNHTNYPWLISRDLLILGALVFLFLFEKRIQARASS